MPTVLLQCGNTPALSFAEVSAVFPEVEHTQVGAYFISSDLNDDDIVKAQKLLGGTVKILKHITTVDLKTDEEQTIAAIAEFLASKDAERVTFCIAEHGRDHLPKVSVVAVKKQLKLLGKKSRFIETKRTGANAAEYKHNKNVTEVALIQTARATLIAEVVWAQDADEWTERDREKPYADRKKGMLPPKVARMMLNIATAGKPSLVVDPFCGTGTVLIEALHLGHTVFGSDADKQSVAGTRENIEWFQSHQITKPLESRVVAADATTVQLPKTDQPIAVVTEPFLGKPKPRPEQVRNILKGLSKLYIGWLKNMADQLPAGSTICMVIPFITTDHGLLGPQKFIDKIPSLGYSIQLEPVMYSRAHATTHRGITTLVKE